MSVKAIRLRNANVQFEGCKALVVGGTAGIGEGIALRLAQAKFDVVIMGRNPERGQAVVDNMKSINPNGQYSFHQIDAMLLSNIKNLSSKFDRLDRLVLTQGIATFQGRTETIEGIDQKMSLHYYSRMAFIMEFLPLLRQSTSAPRVLSVLSGGVHSPYARFKEDPEMKSNYSLKNAADAAGFYNDLMLESFSEDQQNSSIVFGHAAPGVVSTNWGTELPWIVRTILRPIKPFLRSAADCAEYMCTFLLETNNDPTAARFRIIDQYGAPAQATKLATPDARLFIRDHTFEVITKAQSSAKSS